MWFAELMYRMKAKVTLEGQITLSKSNIPLRIPFKHGSNVYSNKVLYRINAAAVLKFRSRSQMNVNCLVVLCPHYKYFIPLNWEQTNVNLQKKKITRHLH
jgi:hypothetical protein